MTLESNMQSAYTLAFDRAMDLLSNEDLNRVAQVSASTLSGDGKAIGIQYLNTEYVVDLVKRTVRPLDQEDREPCPSITEQVLILHYLTTPTRHLPLEKRLISVKEIPEAQVYNAAFLKRVVKPLVKKYAEDLAGFGRAGKGLNAKVESYGHASHTINIFPMVPVTYIIWQGDDEIPSSGTVLFDASITNYLPSEDIVVAASYGVYAHWNKNV